MGKTAEDICNLISRNYAKVSLANISDSSENKHKTLYSCVCCNDIKNYNPYGALFDGNGLYDSIERKITEELAIAIDQNNVQRVKYLKSKYGELKEFKNAKEFLNKKCKEIWNVYEPINNLPQNAMKTLGITNQPDLDFMLSNSIRYYEKAGSETTSYLIASILKNENLTYTIEDIHKYLKEMNKKQKCKYNFKTIKYLIEKQNYSNEKLKDLGVESDIISAVLKNLPLKYKLNFWIKKIHNKIACF